MGVGLMIKTDMKTIYPTHIGVTVHDYEIEEAANHASEFASSEDHTHRLPYEVEEPKPHWRVCANDHGETQHVSQSFDLDVNGELISHSHKDNREPAMFDTEDEAWKFAEKEQAKVIDKLTKEIKSYSVDLPTWVWVDQIAHFKNVRGTTIHTVIEIEIGDDVIKAHAEYGGPQRNSETGDSIWAFGRALKEFKKKLEAHFGGSIPEEKPKDGPCKLETARYVLHQVVHYESPWGNKNERDNSVQYALDLINELVEEKEEE
jgi:hypothetical protein